jgi:hypothetical protein
VGLDVGLHGVDAEVQEARAGRIEQRADAVVGVDVREVVGDVADQEAFGDGLVAVEVTGAVVGADPGAWGGGFA